MSNLLSPEELTQLTGAKRATYQRRALDRAGVRYVLRIDGTLATTWDAVNSALAGPSSPPQNEEEPHLDFLRGPKAQRQ